MNKHFLLVCLNILVFLSPFLLYQRYLYADEIYLKNGDRISGRIIEESRGSITIETEALGSITINRKHIKDIIAGGEGEAEEQAAAGEEQFSAPTEAEEAGAGKGKEKLWQGEASAGYDKSSGNTRHSQLSARLYVNRKTDYNELTAKGDFYYSSSHRKMDSQKWYGMGRYAFSFWRRKWYNFYKLEADHDRFANIDYRIIPCAGIGYWLADEPDWKAMAEVAIGLEHTDFRDDTKDRDETVLVPRAFLEKKLFGGLRILEDITLYPVVSDTSDYRLHSETTLINPINEKLSLRFSLIDDYNSNPPKETKKNDIQIISSLAYSF